MNDITPDRWAICPVCDDVFEQPATGRRRVYCSDRCKQKQFRNAQTVTKLTEAQRSDLVKQALAYGDWRNGQLPAWARYRCLVCADLLPEEPYGQIVRGWYDWNSWQDGKYTRLLCENCKGENL